MLGREFGAKGDEWFVEVRLRAEEFAEMVTDNVWPEGWVPRLHHASYFGWRAEWGVWYDDFLLRPLSCMCWARLAL